MPITQAPNAPPLNTYISASAGTPLYMLKLEHQRYSHLQYMHIVQGSHFAETKKSGHLILDGEEGEGVCRLNFYSATQLEE
jgi:hypothetical protein